MTLRAILFILASTMLLALNDANNKYLVQSLPLLEISWARFASQTIVMLLLFGPRAGARLVRTRRPAFQVARGALLGISAVLGIVVLGQLPIAEAEAIFFLNPTLTVLLGRYLLKERVGSGVYIAAAIGFVGVLAIARPGGAVVGWAAAVGVMCALITAVYQIMTRIIAAEDAMASSFYPAIVSAILLSLLLPFVWRPPPDLKSAAMMCVLGVQGGIAQYFAFKGFSLAPASLLAPLLYVQLVFAVLVGWLFFDALPDVPALVGMAFIVVSGLCVLLRRPPGRAAPVAPKDSTNTVGTIVDAPAPPR